MNIFELFKYDPYRNREYRKFEKAIQTFLQRMGGEHGRIDLIDMDTFAALLKKTIPGIIVARRLEGGGILVMLRTGREDTPATCTSFNIWGDPSRLYIKRPPVEDPNALNLWVDTLLLS